VSKPYLEKQLREFGLTGFEGTKLPKNVFYRQEKALEALNELIESGDHKPWEVTLFAEEVGHGGKRRFIVDTIAHFAMETAPDTLLSKRRGHFYEVILESRPCWLYFDLEFSKESNPKLKPKLVMHAFRKTLNAFCQEILGMTMDSKDMLELESSTAKKFSRHVIVKALLDQTGETTKKALAFANNAQAGLLVDHLVKYAESHRHDSQSLSKYLFVEAPDRKDGCEGREVCVIDESVYSRNRSFRLLFQSKFGKDRTLELDHDRCDPYFGGPKPFPCIALVQTMASFVPGGTQLFQHHLIPADYGHLQAKASRVLKGGSVVIRRDNGSTCTVQCDPLLNHLVRFWDDIRCDNERRPERNWPETTVQSSVEMDGRFMTITLGNNRFCFCKKASHLSNHVYLVVDLLRAEFYQKCFDPDCRGYASPIFKLPSWIVESMLEEEDFVKSLCAKGFESEVDQPAKRLRTGGA